MRDDVPSGPPRDRTEPPGALMEFSAADVLSDLIDLIDVPLSDIVEAVKSGEAATETMRRIAPADGTQLLVAASFNSAI